MRLKLDENADPICRRPAEAAGHQVSTMVEKYLQGTTDHVISNN